MYRVIGKIKENGRLVGLRCTDGKMNLDVKLSDVYDNIDLFDVRPWGISFRFKDGERSFVNLKEIDRSTGAVPSIIDCLQSYSGRDLKVLINQVTSNAIGERDFVVSVYEFLVSGYTSVYSLHGLRGVGKTYGILQALKRVGEYNNTVFITITKPISTMELRWYIDNNFPKVKYIAIDEITMVTDLVMYGAFLHDCYAYMGKRVVISGTDSLCLVAVSSKSLFHRVVNHCCTFISYTEAKRTIGMSLDEYLEMGGLYPSAQFKDLVGLRNYVDDAVVENILHTLTKEGVESGVGDISVFSKKKKLLRSAIFCILYSVIYSPKNLNGINVKKFSNLFLKGESSNSISDDILGELDIYTDLSSFRVTSGDMVRLVNVLVKLGLLEKLNNLHQTGGYNYYITNPCMANQLVLSIVSGGLKLGNTLKSGKNIRFMKGLVLESIVVCHTVQNCGRFNVGFYHNNKNHSEIDLIVYDDEVGGRYMPALFFEIKLVNDVDIAVAKTRWLNEPGIASECKAIEKAILYCGSKAVRFKGYTTDVVDNYGLEEKNMGTYLFPVVRYLEEIDKFIEALEGYSKYY